MKRSNDEIYLEETKRKEIKLTTTTTRCQVIITLDQTIGSKLLHHKFKYLTSELQLFLQNVAVLSCYPLKVIGTTFDNIDSCIFSAVIRNNFYNPSNKDLIKTVVGDMLDFYSDNDENIQKLAKLLKGLLNDELFILQALEEFKKGENNENPLEYISDQLKDDEKFMLKAIKIIGDSIKYASDRLRKILLKGIENDQLSSDVEEDSDEDDGYDQLFDEDKEKIILDSFKSNSKLEPNILAMLEENNYRLFRSFNRLNDNEQIVLEVIKHNSRGFQYASNRLKHDEEFILEALKVKCYILGYVSDRLKDNEEIVLEAIKQNGCALYYASNRLKDNELIVLEAVKQDSSALEYASDRFKDNEEYVLEAVKQNGYAFEHASDRLKDNEKIVLEAINQHGHALKYASDRLKDDELIALEAVKQKGRFLEYASERLKDNEEFILQVVKLNGDALEYVSNRLKDNEKIVMEAINQDSFALYYASNRLKNDFNFANEIFNNCNTLEVFEYFGEELRNIEFIYYYIENYQSKFHELIRKNIRRRNTNAYTDFFKIINAEEVEDICPEYPSDILALYQL